MTMIIATQVAKMIMMIMVLTMAVMKMIMIIMTTMIIIVMILIIIMLDCVSEKHINCSSSFHLKQNVSIVNIFECK